MHMGTYSKSALLHPSKLDAFSAQYRHWRASNHSVLVAVCKCLLELHINTSTAHPSIAWQGLCPVTACSSRQPQIYTRVNDVACGVHPGSLNPTESGPWLRSSSATTYGTTTQGT
jgi:hypothetical protein